MAGLPRLSRQEETNLANDVRRWQRLELVREELSRQQAGVNGGGWSAQVGVEAWAIAAGMTVAVRKRLIVQVDPIELLAYSYVTLNGVRLACSPPSPHILPHHALFLFLPPPLPPPANSYFKPFRLLKLCPLIPVCLALHFAYI